MGGRIAETTSSEIIETLKSASQKKKKVIRDYCPSFSQGDRSPAGEEGADRSLQERGERF